ncbi:hypothetical protein [uncultured Corynebacterium sp.]|nr:hypothetical protein [uncultured Corynebacterium sp.]
MSASIRTGHDITVAKVQLRHGIVLVSPRPDRATLLKVTAPTPRA